MAYVKSNDEKYGLKVISRDPKTSHVDGLQCHFYIFVCRQAKVGSKCKPASNVQAWRSLFLYNKFKAHLDNQYPLIWSEYMKLASTEARRRFFEYCSDNYRNTIPSNFITESIFQRSMVF